MDFIECSSAQVDIILDTIVYTMYDSICRVSNCLDKISSIRLSGGWNDDTFWSLCRLFQQYEAKKGDSSLPHLISLFAPFPNDVISTELDWIDEIDFRFMRRCLKNEVAAPQHKEALQSLHELIILSLEEAVRKDKNNNIYVWKYWLECRSQENINELFSRTDKKIYVSTNWYKKTLDRVSSFIKRSSVKVNIILGCNEITGRFIDYLSECVDKISSISLLDGFNDYSFWWMCRLFKDYKGVNGDNSLPQLISLFAPFPNKVPLPDIDNEEYSFYFSFLSQCHPDKVAAPQYKEALQSLEQLITRSLVEAERKGFQSQACCYKYLMDCGNQWNFNEYLRLTNNEVHVNPIWSEETLKTMSDFIKQSSSKVNMILAYDGYCEIRERCVHFLSDCVGWTSSIRFSTGFNEKSFITMMELCQTYDGITGDSNLYKFVGLFGPFPNKVDFKDTSRISQVDFSFLQKYLNKDVTQWLTHSDSLSALDQFIIRTLFNISRHDRTCYSDIRQYIQQSRNVRLSDKEVFVSCRWNKEILNSVMDFVECSSTQVDMMVDSINYGKHNFISHVSDCLDKISSIRFLEGFDEFTFWWMCNLFNECKRVKGDNSLPHLISLFAPFPNMVPLIECDEDDFIDVTFLSQSQQNKVAIPEHREAFQDLRRCVLSSLLAAVRVGQISDTWYYQCVVDCGDLNDFNEYLRLSDNEVHVDSNWREETLKTMSCFIKSSSSKADIIVDDIDDYCDINEGFVHFLSDCLDWISSIRCNEDVLLTCSKLLYTGGQRLANLFLKKLGHTIEIKKSRLKNSSCKYLGKLMSHCRRDLSLTLTTKAITLRGLQLLCKSWRHLKTLRINEVTTKLISKLIRTKRKEESITVEEMVILRGRQRSTIQRPHLISYLSIILRHWNVNQLDLSDCDLDGQFVTNLLSLQDHISLRLSKKTLQGLVFIIYEIQDVHLLKSFLKKVGYDLRSCKLNWNVLHFLLSHSDERIKTDLRRSDLQERDLLELLPWLHRVHPSRMNGRLSKMLLKVIIDSGSVELIDLWLQLSDHRVNFNNTELGSSHCDALRLFTERSCRVRLSLLWTSFTDETAEQLLSMMGRVSELSLDRNTLLKFLHKLIEVNQPETAQHFTKALRCTLDFSSSSKIDISSDDTSHLLKLSFTDCQVISKSVGLLKDKIELNINDCEIEDGRLEVLFDIFDKVHLRTSKELLLRFISMTDENNTSRIISLGRAIGSTIDLSGTSLSADTCRSLAIVINYIEEDCEVDLSKCSLSTECIERLSACLHKIQDL
ncbi:uncharacterized protein LOC114643014, partial [Erpetoichthys calabaricus]|uniref:uncharacterized protein LOC114643014 n=1 Tax=Erpetoichthys calabaricus TaxID=27687 RepID=UPI002234CD6F